MNRIDEFTIRRLQKNLDAGNKQFLIRLQKETPDEHAEVVIGELCKIFSARENMVLLAIESEDPNKTEVVVRYYGEISRSQLQLLLMGIDD